MVDIHSAQANEPPSVRPGAASVATASDIRVPGEPGVWVMIFGDMVAFAAFFGVFMYSRGNDPALFDASRGHLHVTYAVIDTVLLLTSSLFVAAAVRQFRAGRRDTAPRLVILAFGCGLGFVVNKALEYRGEIDNEITMTTNLFYTFFFTMTAVHLLHLVIGLVGLSVMWRLARRPEPTTGNLLVIEVGATYWHMVDLLWVVIFPLLYLVR